MNLIEKQKKIRNILKANLKLTEDPEKIDLNKPLSEIGMNSLKFMRFLVYLENEFDIEIENDQLDIENFETIEKISLFIENLS